MTSTESSTVDDDPRSEGEEWRRLEAAVRSMLDEQQAWRRRAAAAERRMRELEAALAAMSAGRLDPVEMADQLRECERENRLLGERMNDAVQVVERIQARLQFIETPTPRDMRPHPTRHSSRGDPGPHPTRHSSRGDPGRAGTAIDA